MCIVLTVALKQSKQVVITNYFLFRMYTTMLSSYKFYLIEKKKITCTILLNKGVTNKTNWSKKKK